MKSEVYLGLLHHPVLDKEGQVITTAVTNLDLHDLARLARTYDLAGVYVIQPLPLQRRLVEKLLAYWVEGGGGEYNWTRKEAFLRMRLTGTFEETTAEIRARTSNQLTIVGTTARNFPGAVDYQSLGARMRFGGAWLICLGTGWGLAPEFLKERADCVLESLRGHGDYNHLSVRTAAAIMLDRLLGE